MNKQPDMNIRRVIVSTCLMAAAFLAVLGGGIFAQEEVVSDAKIELTRVMLEEKLEERLKKRISFLLQDENIVVIVKLRLEGERIPYDLEEDADEEFALPGVPVEKKLTDEKRRTKNDVIQIQNNKISNIYAWIFVTKSVPEDVLSRVKELTTEMLGIDINRGDVIAIETYPRNSTVISSVFDNVDIIKTGVVVFILMGLLIFLFGPIWWFLKSVINSGGSGRLAADTGIVNRPLQGQNSGVIQEARRTPSESPAGEESMADILEGSDIDDLVHIVSTGTTAEAVTMINSLPPGTASKVFEKLSVEKQREIINQIKETKFLNPEAVKTINSNLKNKIKYIYGGTKRISELIQRCEKSTKENIVNWLKDENPAIAKDIQDNLLELRDIISYDDQSFRKIYREAGHQDFARVLKHYGDEYISLVLPKLNKEVANLLNEHIKIEQPNARIAEEAELRIIDIVKRLVNEGYIEPVK
ncbi:MAG: hypothetical protein JXJ19_09965 [Elusimicrobia bacterium]|nr:hypothetical protein [Elusimicrobiota bacterium]